MCSTNKFTFYFLVNLNFLPKLKCFVQLEEVEKTDKLTDEFLSHVGNGKSNEHKRNNFKGNNFKKGFSIFL